MYLKRIQLVLMGLITALPSIQGQSLQGNWHGQITMQGYSDYFHYAIQIEESENGTLNGTSISMLRDSSVQVRFQLTGKQEGTQVFLQELQQISTPPPQWCLKYSKLELVERNDSLLLLGDWSGGECNPGKVYLYQVPEVSRVSKTKWLPFSKIGRWTGHLDQSDRTYGFFYELELQEDGTGTSSIVSEGSGGEATHALQWQFDSITQMISIQEREVIKRTDPKWKWCIKQLNLQVKKVGNAYQLMGNWEGHIEGNLSKAGACAPGKVFLEKPQLSQVIVEEIRTNSQSYVLEQQRKIKIDRVLEVKRPQLRLAVWDNGVVDGDIMTLYLNGKKIFDHYKVRDRKAYINIELQEDHNFLVLHADDLGEITPNTVAISIYDGHKEQIIVMSSNLEESGAVLIKQIKLN
ncbi:MAG: hypothetical protein Sapg2KO_38060 [Saprospiraceae bacterium]